MIHFDRVAEPSEFDAKVRKPGLSWMKSNPEAQRPKDLWSPFKMPLADGFRMLCAYSAMWEPVGTVDHYVSCAEDASRAYEWDNYRYASQWINSSKSGKKNEPMRVLDPFEVNDMWFELILPSLQLVVSDSIPENLRRRAEYTLERLHLRDDERVLRQRREWFRMYCEGELTIEGLRKKAPLIARAVEKQQGKAR